MAADSRDWYRDWWRKKTNYVERAGFRMSEGDRKRQQFRDRWKRNFVIVGVMICAILLMAIAKQLQR